MTITPIIPISRPNPPFDDPAYLYELKYDGFRGLADTLNGRILSKNKNRMKRFEGILENLPRGFVFDGEIVALDERGRPVFNDLLFGRREPTYIPCLSAPITRRPVAIRHHETVGWMCLRARA